MGHGQVVGGGIDIDMAEISRQMRQEPLHVLAFPVPANQSPDCKSMSVMPISALAAACRVLDYAESGGVAFLPTPFGASFRTPLTK